MRRDPELIRRIVLSIEDSPHGFAPDDLAFDGYSEEMVGYHCWLLINMGLANGGDITGDGDMSPNGSIVSLTPWGHDFAEAARNETVWSTVMDQAQKAGGVVLSAIVTAVIQYGIEYGKQKLGLHGT